MAENNQGKFEFFISEKGAILVVLLVGPMDGSAKDAMDSVAGHIEGKKEIKFVVVNLRDVSEISNSIIPSLTNLQRKIRARPAQLRLCGVKPEFKGKLLTQGVVRSAEITDNLRLALDSLIAMSAKKSD